MKKIFISVIAFFLFYTVQAQQKPEDDAKKFPDAGSIANAKLTYKIIDAPEHTYCYDVYSDGKLLIHQKSIPALPGNKGFKTKSDAEKIAQLVISKIKKGEMPPTVSVEEMTKMNVIK